MNRVRGWSFVAVLLAGWGSAATVVAAPLYREFLKGLRDRGYGEQALEYIDLIERRSDLPDAVKDVLDLERGLSLRVASERAYNAEQRAQRLAESEKRIDNFIKTHPEHPEGASILVNWGSFSLEAAERFLRQSQLAKDEAQKAKLVDSAKASIDVARPRFSAALELLEKRREPLAEAAKSETKKGKTPAAPNEKLKALADVNYEILEIRFKLALTDYFLVQMLEPSMQAERKKALADVAKTFDAIYQSNRENPAGLVSHMWHGRVVEEQGNLPLAIDIYDEVLANTPSRPAQAPAFLAEIFSRVYLFRVKAAAKQKPSGETFVEAREWLQAFKVWQPFSGYQGVALELVKWELAAAEKQSDEKRRATIRNAIAALEAIAKVDSEFQEEAVQLKRQLQKSDGGEPVNSGEFEGLAKSAAANGDWKEALEALSKSLALVEAAKPVDAKKVALLRSQVNEVRYRQAIALYGEGKLEEALVLAETVARDNPDDPVAPAAMGAAVSTALVLYGKATDKPAALKRLQELADFMFKHWSDRVEADEARFALGQANLVKGDLDAGIELLKKINPQSKRYPQSLHFIGQVSWKRFLDERKKSDAQRDPVVMSKSLAAARDNLTKSFDLQKKAAEGQSAANATQLADTQMMLADVSAESKDYAGAIKLFQPLLEEFHKAAEQSEKPTASDPRALRVCLGAFKANMAAGNSVDAANAAVTLVLLTPDSAQNNPFLVDCTKNLATHIRDLRAATKAAKPGSADALAATKELDQLREPMEKILANVSQRQFLSVPALLLMADSYSAAGNHDKARSVYESIVKRAATDKKFGESAGKSMIGIRAQLVGLLREKGDFPGAITQIDELIKANPKALEPLLEKGRILQAFAEKDSKQYAAAVAHWTEVRVLLQRANPKPKEYYDVVYNTASCLLNDSKTITDKAKKDARALDAQKLLNSTLTLEPDLSGPDMVARYQALLKKIISARGKTPDP